MAIALDKSSRHSGMGGAVGTLSSPQSSLKLPIEAGFPEGKMNFNRSGSVLFKTPRPLSSGTRTPKDRPVGCTCSHGWLN